MSKQLTDNTIEMVQKLDDMPVKEIKEILPYKDYETLDIANAADLIKKMLKWIPADRISCEEALTHDFFKGVKSPSESKHD